MLNEKDFKVIEKMSRKGVDPRIIADCVGISVRRIYEILKRVHPNRPRKQRFQITPLRIKILGLDASGSGPAHIAAELGISRAYVYRILGED